MPSTDVDLTVLQRRYDEGVAATNGLGYPAQLRECRDGRLRARACPDRHTRPGGTIPGPTPIILADGLAWLLLIAHLPAGSDAYTTDMGVQLLHGGRVGEVDVELTIERLGARRAVVSALVSSVVEQRLLAHLLLGFSLRRPDHTGSDRSR
ncbi:thioesterase superfamily protein [Mycolicibacterium rhodesiae JS60]|nr:thioesterase superfamily protein [Mycolicibacterium rhodesiae JS60]